jgi:hypothetical protein
MGFHHVGLAWEDIFGGRNIRQTITLFGPPDWPSSPKIESAHRPKPEADREFYSSIAGVRYNNEDGSSRQQIIKDGIRPGDALGFRFEDDNPVDPFAVVVLTPDGRQAGYLHTRTESNGLAEEVRKWVADGSPVRLTVTEVTEGTPDKLTRGVNFLVQVYEPQPEEEQERILIEIQILQDLIVESGYFVPEKIPSLMAILGDERQHSFGKVTHSVLEYGGQNYPVLTREEKRTLTLNTRKTYTKALISYFNPSSLVIAHPADFGMAGFCAGRE